MLVRVDVTPLCDKTIVLVTWGHLVLSCHTACTRTWEEGHFGGEGCIVRHDHGCHAEDFYRVEGNHHIAHHRTLRNVGTTVARPHKTIKF